MKYEITWTYGGFTTVEADNAQEARERFRETFDLAAHAKNDPEGVDIIEVERQD